MFPLEFLLGTIPAVEKELLGALSGEQRNKLHTLLTTASNTGILKINSNIKLCATNVTPEEYQMLLRN